MALLLAPLYTRLRRDQVLEHFVRGQVYHDIRDHPGDHYSSIRARVGISNGVLAYHLHMLERQGFVRAERDGVLKRFYPAGVLVPQETGIRLSRVQQRIVDVVGASPSITQEEIAKRTGASHQLVSHNVRVLERLGLLTGRREGRVVRWEPVPDDPVRARGPTANQATPLAIPVHEAEMRGDR